MGTLLQIINKIIFSAVVVEKYFLSLVRYRVTKNPLTSNLVVTDIEYLFANARSLYDLLQELIKYLWERENKPKMKGTFREIVQQSKEQLVSKYRLPEPMIQYYSSSKDFFFKIGAIRDAVFHPPAELTMQLSRFLFSDDDGFALMKNELSPYSLSLSFDLASRED